MCCPLCSNLLINRRRKTKSRPHAPKHNLPPRPHRPRPSTDTARARGDLSPCWFPGQGDVRKSQIQNSCTVHIPLFSVFVSSHSCTFFTTSCFFQRPSESGKTARWPSKETSWGISSHRLLSKSGNSKYSCVRVYYNSDLISRHLHFLKVKWEIRCRMKNRDIICEEVIKMRKKQMWKEGVSCSFC